MENINELKERLFKYPLFENTILSLRKFLKNEKPQKIVVAYSGGKDSTVLLLITTIVLAELNLPLVITTVDTLVENPVISQHIKNSLREFKEMSKGLFPCETKILKPDLNFSFWVCVIGKGYPPPTPWFRWCQNHLKIKPTKKFLLSLKEKTVLLTGHRLEESIERKRILKKNKIGKNQLYFAHDGIRQYLPLVYWKEADIWRFLSICNQRKIIGLYNSTNGSRFGCWVCTLVRKDKTLKNQAKQNPLLEELFCFKEWLKEYANKVQNRSGFSRSGKFLGPGKGCLTFQTRKEILRRLLMLQDKVKLNLISQSEIKLIRRLWASG